jgi:hypothetical protein
MKKLFDNVKVAPSLDAEALTVATTGATLVDTQGYNDGMLVVVSGDITCTTGDTYRVKVMECDTTNGVFTDSGIYVDFAGATGTLAGQNSVKSARVKELNVMRKRYLRVDLALTATTTAWEGAGIILLGEPVSSPVNND